jgi:hypothetical protein
MAWVAEQWHFERLIFLFFLLFFLFFFFLSFLFLFSFFFEECSAMIPFASTIHDCQYRIECHTIQYTTQSRPAASMNKTKDSHK